MVRSIARYSDVKLTLLNRPKLLHIHPIDEHHENTDTSESNDTEPHVDERQIQLDTDRSFVLYPVGIPHLYAHPAPS